MSTTTTSKKLCYEQRVVVTDNGDPDDPYTGILGTVNNFSRWRSGWIYEVWLDSPVRGRHIAQFREDELEAVA